MDLTGVLNRIISILPASTRQATLKLDDGSQRTFLYDDAANKYNEIDTFLFLKINVSSLPSFCDIVAAELKKTADDPGVARPIVMFHKDWAKFYPDMDDPRIYHTYTRQISEAWRRMRQLTSGGWMDQPNFVRALQGLARNIENSATVLRHFRKISVNEQVSIESVPFVEEGKAGHSYSVRLSVKGGIAETSLPSQLRFVDIPFLRNASGGETYSMDADIDIEMTQDRDSNKKSLRFSVHAPTLVADEEGIINAEVEKFTETLSSMVPPAQAERLLVVESF